jgi:bacterioferritin
MEPMMESQALAPSVTARRTESQPRGNGNAFAAGSDPEAATLADILNQALGIAQFAALSCELHYVAALRDHSPQRAAVALEHAYEAQASVDGISRRIGELGWEPYASPEAPVPRTAARKGNGDGRDPAPGDILADARAAVDAYRRIAASPVALDPTTKALIDDILASEEKRAGVLAALLHRPARLPEP